MKTIRIRITGPQGSGKTTIGKIIADELARLGFSGLVGCKDDDSPEELKPSDAPFTATSPLVTDRLLQKRTRVEIIA